jgi:hypothetical protein
MRGALRSLQRPAALLAIVVAASLLLVQQGEITV